MGIEPTSEAWEASILPLYDARSAPHNLVIIHKQATASTFRPFSVTPLRGLVSWKIRARISRSFETHAELRNIGAL